MRPPSPPPPPIQDQLAQLEADCSAVEIEILDSHVLHDTSGQPASEMESAATVAERERVFCRRSDVQRRSEVLGSVVNMLHLQLQLCGRLQEDRALVATAAEFVGGQSEVKEMVMRLEVGWVHNVHMYMYVICMCGCLHVHNVG